MGWKERNEFSAQPRSLQQQNNSHNWFLLSWENFIDSLSLSLSHQRPSLPLFAINVCLISSAFPSLSLSLALSLFLCLQHLVHIGAILSFTLSGLTSSLSLSLLTLVYCPSLLCTLTLFFTPPQKKPHNLCLKPRHIISFFLKSTTTATTILSILLSNLSQLTARNNLYRKKWETGRKTNEEQSLLFF